MQFWVPETVRQNQSRESLKELSSKNGVAGIETKNEGRNGLIGTITVNADSSIVSRKPLIFVCVRTSLGGYLLLVNRHHRGGPRCFDDRLSRHWMALARHHRGRPQCLHNRLSGHPMAGQVEVILRLLGILQLVSNSSDGYQFNDEEVSGKFSKMSSWNLRVSWEVCAKCMKNISNVRSFDVGVRAELWMYLRERFMSKLEYWLWVHGWPLRVAGVWKLISKMLEIVGTIWTIYLWWVEVASRRIVKHLRNLLLRVSEEEAVDAKRVRVWSRCSIPLTGCPLPSWGSDEIRFGRSSQKARVG